MIHSTHYQQLITVTTQAANIRNLITQILGVHASYADGVGRIKYPKGGVRYCWMINKLTKNSRGLLNNLIRDCKDNPNISIKLVKATQIPGYYSDRETNLYVRCKVIATKEQLSIDRDMRAAKRASRVEVDKDYSVSIR